MMFPNVSRNHDLVHYQYTGKANCKTVSINSGTVNINIPKKIYEPERIKVNKTQNDLNNEKVLIASLDHNIWV